MFTDVPTKQIPFAKQLGYRKRKVNVRAAESFTIHGVNWSGGSKTVYHAVDLVTNEVKSLGHFGDRAPWDNPYEGATLPTVPGIAVVQTGWFCGKTATMFVTVHPADMPKLLPHD